MAAATLHTDAVSAAALFKADAVETSRLRLRMFRHEDLDALCAITRDPEVMRYIGYGHALTREETRANLASIIAAFRRRGFGRWALELKGTGELVGYCGLSLGNEEAGVELAYMLARGAWGRGLALEAGRACLRYGFERLGLKSIAGLTLHDNRRSRRVLSKLGMGFVRDAHFYGFDCVHYLIAREDWRDDGSFYRVKNGN
ncbi:MAG TPA: GNAT family N-acetyltransferase [Pyrinomonadaceae bacterium]|jgi:RimJ/RimL family protein N-acetyltransferase